MTHDEKLEQLRMELARQDAALDEARQQMAALAELPFEVPTEWLNEIEEACAPPPILRGAIVVGIRG
ncbi:MAG: hypothetical protein QOI41_2264 [Myxococcales bacterium]|nr:hypothetical protein [Myxococcales bacterium]